MTYHRWGDLITKIDQIFLFSSLDYNVRLWQPSSWFQSSPTGWCYTTLSFPGFEFSPPHPSLTLLTPVWDISLCFWSSPSHLWLQPRIGGEYLSVDLLPIKQRVGKPGPQEFIHFSGGACFFSRHMFCHLGFCFPFLTNIESFLCASNMRETFEMNMEEPACQEYDDILFGISLQEIYQRNMEVSTFQGYDDISFGISQPSFAFKKTRVSMVWLWNSENWRQPYILKAKRFAESAFQSRKICGKSASISTL